jgi:hypothetical protein
VDDVFIHHMVEKAIIRLEQQQAVAVSLELEIASSKAGVTLQWPVVVQGE